MTRLPPAGKIFRKTQAMDMLPLSCNWESCYSSCTPQPCAGIIGWPFSRRYTDGGACLSQSLYRSRKQRDAIEYTCSKSRPHSAIQHPGNSSEPNPHSFPRSSGIEPGPGVAYGHPLWRTDWLLRTQSTPAGFSQRSMMRTERLLRSVVLSATSPFAEAGGRGVTCHRC